MGCVCVFVYPQPKQPAGRGSLARLPSFSLSSVRVICLSIYPPTALAGEPYYRMAFSSDPYGPPAYALFHARPGPARPGPAWASRS